jgi:hypothetical protein
LVFVFDIFIFLITVISLAVVITDGAAVAAVLVSSSEVSVLKAAELDLLSNPT